MKQQINFNLYASIINRKCKNYADRALRQYQIGSSQQMFLVLIYEKPGTNLFFLAHEYHFDKATITKAIQKLKELGFIRVEIDLHDKRNHKLYVTDEAVKVVERIYKIKEEVEQLLLQDMSEEEILLASKYMQMLAFHAMKYLDE